MSQARLPILLTYSPNFQKIKPAHDLIKSINMQHYMQNGTPKTKKSLSKMASWLVTNVRSVKRWGVLYLDLLSMKSKSMPSGACSINSEIYCFWQKPNLVKALSSSYYFLWLSNYNVFLSPFEVNIKS